MISKDPCKKPGLVIQLILLAHRLEDTAERCFFAPHGLSMSTGRILMCLYRSDPQTPTEILNELGGKKSNITQRIALLEKMKLVARQTPKPNSDRRHIRFGLTALGKRHAKMLDQIFTINIDALEKHIGPQQWETVMSVLNTIHEKLDATPPSSSR